MIDVIIFISIIIYMIGYMLAMVLVGAAVAYGTMLALAYVGDKVVPQDSDTLASAWIFGSFAVGMVAVVIVMSFLNKLIIGI